MPGVALINGKNFVHSDIIFQIGGVPILSLSNLQMTSKKQKDFSYGTGNLPVGYGIGRNEPVDVTFELSMTDGIAIDRASEGNDSLNLDPFDIPITFANSSNASLIILKNVMITEVQRSSDTDTTDIKWSYTAIASHNPIK